MVRASEAELQRTSTNLIAEDNIVFLEEFARIDDGFSDELDDYFDQITSICLDSANNLYIADSGVHKVFRFNEQGRFEGSIGGAGQGPGEFMGTLRISTGRDGRLYITDDRNRRLVVYTLMGEFIKQFPIDSTLHDVPAVNSKSEIFLVSPSGLKLIDHYDSDMKLKGTLLEFGDNLESRINPPLRNASMARFRPSEYAIRKFITNEDELILVSNLSLGITILNKHQEVIAKFSIENPTLLNNYKKRMKEVVLNGGWIYCFTAAFLDNNSNICLCYYNSEIEQPEVYRYSMDGHFIDILRMKGKSIETSQILCACDNRGKIYAINSKNQCVVVYRKNEI